MSDGPRKLLALLLALLGLFVSGMVAFAQSPDRPTPASVFLMVGAACLWFLAARLLPARGGQRDEPGFVSRLAHGRMVLMFGAILFLLAYGLWAMFTASL